MRMAARCRQALRPTSRVRGLSTTRQSQADDLTVGIAARPGEAGRGAIRQDQPTQRKEGTPTMLIFWIVIAGAALFALTLLYVAFKVGDSNPNDPGAGSGLFGTALVIGCIALVAALVGGIMAAWPNYQLWSAKIERERIVVQAVQEADAAREQARGEVFRAEGVAEANRIVAESLTAEYLRYHYINTLAENNQNVIYIPTEAGLPILEAGGQFGQRNQTEE